MVINRDVGNAHAVNNWRKGIPLSLRCTNVYVCISGLFWDDLYHDTSQNPPGRAERTLLSQRMVRDLVCELYS